MAEDTVDKYLMTRFERKVQNPYIQSIVRGIVNPARSFAKYDGAPNTLVTRHAAKSI